MSVLFRDFVGIVFLSLSYSCFLRRFRLIFLMWDGETGGVGEGWEGTGSEGRGPDRGTTTSVQNDSQKQKKAPT